MVARNRLDGLLNEYKGNFFEYLVAIEFSRRENLERDFLDSLNDSFYQMLEQQESFLRNYYSYLLIELPKLAALAVDNFQKHNPESFEHVLLAGKSLGASHDDRFSEADILLRNKKHIVPISLKLAKSNSFVNTKSGGIKSFFNKYFEGEGIESIQRDFYGVFENEYNLFSHKIHAHNDLNYEGNFKQYEMLDLAVLPGQLKGEERNYLLEFYKAVNDKLYSSLKNLFENSPNKFNQGLSFISGHSDSNLIHITCFYTLKEKNFIKKKIIINSENDSLVCKEIKQNKGSVDIYTRDNIIQVRLKPMNKFTNKGFKINCAIKETN